MLVQTRKKLRTLLIVTAAITIAAALIYALFLSPIPFDSARWQNDDRRWRMEQDLEWRIIGLTMDEVLDMLGESLGGYDRPDRLAYNIGGPPRPFRYIEVAPFNSWHVVIIFDRNGGTAVEVIFTNRVPQWMGG